MKNIRNWIVSVAMAVSVGGTLLTVATPQAAYAAPADTCNSGFLGFPAWYRGLTDNRCNIKSTNILNTAKSGEPSNGLSNLIWGIGINVLEIALVATVYASAAYMLYGGFIFLASEGKPENAAKGRSTLLHSFVGLAISIAAVVAVDFVAAGIMK